MKPVCANGVLKMYQIDISDEKVADNLLEGDILLDPLEPDDYKIIKLVKEDKKIEAEQRLQKRQASRQLKRLWHNRVVPYHIDPSLGKRSRRILHDKHNSPKK